MLDRHELFGSKLAALLSRCKPRDLYDVYRLINSDIEIDIIMLKKCAIFYNCVGGNTDIDTNDFFMLDGINKSMIFRTLNPVIAKTDQFEYIKAVDEVKTFLKRLLALNESEKDFVVAFREREYKPELLFTGKEIITRTKEHFMALWKCRGDG